MLMVSGAESAQVNWLELGVNPEDAERMLAGDEVEAFVSRLSRPLRERAFRAAGVGAIAAMSDGEAGRAVANGVRANRVQTVEALRRVVLCHRLVSGKRTDALALVEEALAGIAERGEAPPEIAAILGGQGDVPLRDFHVLIALELLERAPERLSLYPLLDRASRVSYRAYVPRRAEPTADLAEQVERLDSDRVIEVVHRALRAAAELGVEAVVALERWRMVFLRAPGAVRIIPTAEGGVVTLDVQRHILWFDLSGGLGVNGGAVAVRLAEALMSKEGMPVRYVPFEPETKRDQLNDWLSRLIEGKIDRAAVDGVSLAFAAFEVEVKGDVAAGLRAFDAGGAGLGAKLGGAGNRHLSERLLESVRAVTFSFAPTSDGASSRYTLSIEEGSHADRARVAYRASSAGLRDREAFEMAAKKWGITLSSR